MLKIYLLLLVEQLHYKHCMSVRSFNCLFTTIKFNTQAHTLAVDIHYLMSQEFLHLS